MNAISPLSTSYKHYDDYLCVIWEEREQTRPILIPFSHTDQNIKTVGGGNGGMCHQIIIIIIIQSIHLYSMFVCVTEMVFHNKHQINDSTHIEFIENQCNSMS